MAEREIKWTSRALRDKTNIYNFWYRKTASVAYPKKLEQLFLSTLTFLSKQPEAGMQFDEKRRIRFVLIKQNRLYYTYSGDELTVLTIWDTRRDETSFQI